ncbi:MAG: Serine hydrolase [Candidatus Poribacteria bacterium]|nr:Serine hydrolase [Candidatus Poribacteria bacterium]
MNKIYALVVFLMFCVSLAVMAVDTDVLIFDIPHLDNISINGDPADWGDKGFHVGMITSENGEILPVSDLNADFRLGWNDQGLLLLIKVDDDVAVESPDENSLWQGDGVQFFVATKPGSPNYYQVIISPGLDLKFPDLRKYISDYRKDKSPKKELTINAVRVKTKTGYMIEASLPWDNLAIEPKLGAEFGFQLYVTDSDSPAERADQSVYMIWYPRSGTYADSSAMYPLRLAEIPSDPVLISVRGNYERMIRTKISVNAVAEMADKKVDVKEGSRVLADGKLIADNGRASVNLNMPMPPVGKPYSKLTVVVDNKPITTLTLPDADEKRARALIEETGFHFQPSVFSGTQFPSCDFENPLSAEALIGQYKIKTTFYDSEYKEVKSAEKPGRYGAIVEITSEKGKMIRRFRTLFRQPEGLDWWGRDINASIEFPQELGINKDVVSEESKAVKNFIKWRITDAFNRDDSIAQIMAGLYEKKPDGIESTVYDDISAMDRQWWVGLKRKLYGMDKKYPEPFTCPKVVEGKTAFMLREGTLTEAGMKPDAVQSIDSVCQAWSADSDEGFAVCIVRHGVVILHKAYGQREGRAMTVNDPSWMASITKLLGGTLMMMLVDQNMVSLNDPVDKFLPAFEGIKVKTPLNIHHLYTHTNGLWGHWGDDINDFDELIADYYPYLKVGQFHSYNGAGYAVAGKVIEMVSGEALPQFFKHHLLDPLGCTNTSVTTMSWDTRSIPMDIAKIGQMLLNKGKYGNMQFFSEETFAKMLPKKLDDILGPDTKIEWGIGATWFDGEGLGKGTFGHGAASSATLRIDPVNDLVIVMTRNSAGKNFGKYHPQFLKAIVDGLESK